MDVIRLIRLIILLTLLGGLIILLVQNLSPALPLVFLGMRTRPFPLSLWILSSTIAGAGTSILITALSKFVNYSIRQPQTVPSPPPPRTTRTSPEKQPPPRSPSPSAEDDWETNNFQDDWDSQSPNSGSSYAYGYQAPKNTAVGKTESIYDADYRVIVPPYQPPRSKSEEEDDWDFFTEDDDFKDQPQRPGK